MKLLTVPPCPAICRSGGGARAPVPYIWSRRHWLAYDVKLHTEARPWKTGTVVGLFQNIVVRHQQVQTAVGVW